MYNDKVMEHFMHPHNAGKMEDPDAVGSYGSPVCGDMMEIYLRIRDNVIEDAKFMTFGCGAAVASSSVATDMVKGKTLEEAVQLTNQNFIDELGSLPGPKVHCSMLAEQAIKNAIYNYAKDRGITVPGLEQYDPDKDIHDEGCEAE